MEKSVRTDPLTGLLNRNGLYERMMSLAHGLGDQRRIAILHIDLDHFKAINSALGYDAGDHVLRYSASVLSRIAPDADMVARVGGDEFILLLRCDGIDRVPIRVAEQIVKTLERPTSFQNRVCNFGASIGLPFLQSNGIAALAEAQTNANIALSAAEKMGHGVVRIFEADMRRDTVEMVQMGQQIRDGLTAGQFTPFFQPQVDVHRGRIIGFEALIRWEHPNLGLVTAFKFLEAAERAGLMARLDEVVMDRACFAVAEMKSWGLTLSMCQHQSFDGPATGHQNRPAFAAIH